MRLTQEELDNIKKEYNVDTLYSWSRVQSFGTSPYEYYLHYVKKVEPDRCDCIYGQEGGYSHDILEDFYNNKIDYKDMGSQFYDTWTIARDVLGLKFNRSDADADNKTANKYYDNLNHFFNNHNKVPYDITCEDFALIKIKDKVLIGYIDGYYVDKNGDYYIIDWKTSSIYTGDTLYEKSGQLILYKLALIQRGISPEKIHCMFNFLKYVSVEYEQKNGKYKSRNIERRNFAEQLKSPITTWLKAYGYEDDISAYLMKVQDNNSLDCLPEEVQDKFSIKDCWVEISADKKDIDFWYNKVYNTITQIENVEFEYALLGDESLWYDSPEQVAKESFYFGTLCEYSPILHKPYAEYLDKLQNQNNIFE